MAKKSSSAKSGLETVKWLQVAIHAEKKALHNYLEYAHHSQNLTGKETFIRLARDEWQHMDILEQELARVKEGLRFKKVSIPISPVEETVSSIDHDSVTTREEGEKNEIDDLALAQQSEKKAMAFYQAKAKEVEDPAAKVILLRLADMESAHYQILQAEMDAISKTGFWMGFREISFEVE